MVDVLHAWALAPAAVGTCCIAADRGRARVADLAASVLMTIAMLDVAVFHVVPAVWWACLLVAAALVHAILNRARRSGVASNRAAMTVHAGAGLIVMAALIVVMATPSGAADLAAGHHGGHGSASPIVLLLVAGYAVSSAWLARRGPTIERLQLATMGAATVLMGLAALL